jgi:hypothetical protein
MIPGTLEEVVYRSWHSETVIPRSASHGSSKLAGRQRPGGDNMRIVGRRTADVFKRYAIVNDDDDRQALEKLESAKNLCNHRE